MTLFKRITYTAVLLFWLCAAPAALYAQVPMESPEVDAKVQELLECYATVPADCAKNLTQDQLPPAEMKSVLLKLGGQFQRDGNMLAELEMFQLLCKWYPDEPLAWVWHDKMARLYKKGWRNYAAAAAELEKSALLQTLPNVKQEKLLAVAFAWYMAEEYGRAAEAVARIEANCQVPLYLGACSLLKAEILLHQSKLPEAATELLSFAQRFPDNPLAAQAKMLLGYIYLQQGNLKEAATELGGLSSAPGDTLAPKLAELLADLPEWIEAAKFARPLVESQKPPLNVLMISLDTVRADHLGCYGYGRDTTPNIDALAAQGTVFEHCMSTSSWTKTSHASVFTGLDAAVHGALNHTQAMAPNCVTLPQILHDAGYYTVGVISAPPLNSLFGFAKGFDWYDDYTYDLDRQNDLFFRSEDNALQIHSGFTGSLITKTALRAYDRLCVNRPFYLFVNYFDAHHNLLPPWPHSMAFGQPYYGSRYGHVDGWLQSETPLAKADPPVDVERLHDLYDGELQYVDKQVGAVVEKLKNENRLDNTLIVLFGDHGEEFMEHGQLTHGRTLYNEVLHVPLIFIGPGVPKGKRVSAPVSQVDIMPTVLKLLGKTVPQGLDGVALLPETPDTSKRAQYAKLDLPEYKFAALVEPPYKLSLNLENHQAELFDLVNDPGEKNNIRDANLDIAMRMLDNLMLWDLHGGDKNKALGGMVDTEGSKPIKMIDSVVERLRSLGYVK